MSIFRWADPSLNRPEPDSGPVAGNFKFPAPADPEGTQRHLAGSLARVRSTYLSGNKHAPTEQPARPPGAHRRGGGHRRSHPFPSALTGGRARACTGFWPRPPTGPPSESQFAIRNDVDRLREAWDKFSPAQPAGRRLAAASRLRRQLARHHRRAAWRAGLAAPPTPQRHRGRGAGPPSGTAAPQTSPARLVSPAPPARSCDRPGAQRPPAIHRTRGSGGALTPARQADGGRRRGPSDLAEIPGDVERERGPVVERDPAVTVAHPLHPPADLPAPDLPLGELEPGQPALASAITVHERGVDLAAAATGARSSRCVTPCA